MSQYDYSPLSSKSDSIRLLRLMPFGNGSLEKTEIQCELFQYNLQDSGKGTHFYEALSYTWGSEDKPRSISIDKQNLAVTENLHAALLRLRDRSLNRILWVDALCINQKDLKEQNQQVQIMAKIYSKAARVLVWLGETADDSDIALEEIRIAAENESPDSLKYKTIRQAILALLQRPWFQRIWVLQEVAAARHILIACGSTEIDGYAFYLGVNYFYEAHPDLEISIRSISYLIRGAIFRPKRGMGWSGRASLGIRPLGQLLDMFHNHKATMPVDKVYALLGMSSDDPGTAGLLPDYEVPWETLFKDLVKFILSNQVHVKTWGEEQRAIIKSKGCALGQVLSVESGDRQKVNIIFKNIPEYLGQKREWHALWNLHSSVKRIQAGDIVCLLERAPKPMIIRPYKDYFTIIRIEFSPEGKPTESGDIEWSKLFASIIAFPRDFLLVWNWENSLEKSQDSEYDALVQTSNWIAECSKTGLGSHLDKATRILDVAMILDDLEEYGTAEERHQQAIESYEIAFGKERTPKSQFGRTPLSWAAGNGYHTVVELLLAKDGIDPSSLDRRSNRTPLWLAAEEGHAAVVQLLLATGKVEADSRDSENRTPLLLAAAGGHTAVVQLLLTSGKVNIDLINKTNGRTPLSLAAGGGHRAVVQLLINTGKVDINSIDKYGLTPLSWAAAKGHEAVVQLLLATDKVNINSMDNNGRTPLWLAAAEGRETIVKLLVATGTTNINLMDRNGQTPLLWAAAKGHATIVQLLVTISEVNINSMDKSGRTPLWLAAEEGHAGVIRLLLETGKFDIHSRDRDGRTPLSLAAGEGYKAMVQLLLEIGKVDIGSKDEDGRTPLWWAMLGEEKSRRDQSYSTRWKAVIQLLLGTDKVSPEPEDKNGVTPSSWLDFQEAAEEDYRRLYADLSM